MKKLSKLIIFILILVMGAGFVPVNLLSTVYADTPSYYSYFSVEGFVSEGTIGSTIFVPKAQATNGTAIIKVVNPNGVDVTATELSVNNEDYLLTPTLTGAYNIIYGISEESLPANGLSFNTKETKYQILVKGTKPTMSFEENSSLIIPSKIGDNTYIVLPYPTVIGTDGDEVSLDNVIANTVINITKPAGVTGDINRTTTTINGKNYVKFTTVENGNGIYTISYEYTDPTINTLKVSENYEVIADTTYVAPTEYTTSRSASVASSLELGKTTTLPKYTLKDKDGNVLQSYTKIEITYVPANSTGFDHVDCNSEIDGYEFTPKHEVKNGAAYQIVYKLYDFANLNGEPAVSKTHTITNVKDTTSPTPYPVASYTEITDEILNAEDYYLDNASYLVPSKIAKGESRNIPAIFARDAYNVTLPTNLTLKRTIITPENVQDTTFVDNNAKEEISYTFSMEGKYTIRYTATDAANNVSTTVSYDVIVEDGFTDSIAPRISIQSSIPSYAKEGTLIKFLKPTAVDYSTNLATETSINDSRTKIETNYFTNDAEVLTKIEEYETDKDYLAFRIPAGVVGNTLTISIKATDDYNNVSTKNIVINLNQITDVDAPTFDNSVVATQSYAQSTIVELPTITINDGNNVIYNTVTAEVIDANGNYVEVYGLKTKIETVSGGYNMEAFNAKFVPTVAGDYKVIYTIKDASNNSTVLAYKIIITDDIYPVVPGPSAWTDKLEVGISTYLPSSIVTDNGEEIVNSSINTIELVSENHSSEYSLNKTTLEFVSYVTGTYQFRYVGQDATGNEAYSKTYTLTVTDEYKPEVKVLSGLKATYDLVENEGVYTDIVVPGFAASDVHENEDNEVVSYNNVVEKYVRIKDPDQKYLDIKIGGVSQNSTKVSTYANEYGFTPTKAGTYTIIYYAKDASGNETTLEKIIKVGDHVAPSITIIDSETEKFDTKFKVGDTLKLDMSKITASDDKDGNINFDTIKNGTTATKLIAVKVVNPSGTTIYRIATSENSASTDATPIYELSATGDYTITYTVKDNTGNTSTKVFTITVEADDENVVVGTEVWGIILIIITLAILAGIIIYFIKTRKVKAKPSAIVRK